MDALTNTDGAVSTARNAAATVNGPEDEDLDWASIDWRRGEEDVRRLRQRIFTASQAGDLKKVRNLQKLMLRSRSNTLLSVRRVTEINAGRDGGSRREGGADVPVQGRSGRLGSAPRPTVDSQARQASAHPQTGDDEEARAPGFP